MNTIKYKMFLDDIRKPYDLDDYNWVVVRNYYDAVSFFLNNGCPVHISFDHDLGYEPTTLDDITPKVGPNGLDVAKWLVNYNLSLDGEFIPKDFTFSVHSANPIGAANIDSYLSNYLKSR